MNFHDVLQSLRPAADGWSATVTDDWLQGRSIFGGLQAALAVRAMRERLPEVPLRSLQTTFMAPIPAGEVRVQAQILRAGKSATHVEARLFDGPQLACVVVGIFGQARPSAVQIQAPVPAALKTADALPDLPYIPGVVPAFIQHLQMRWADGGYPFSGHPQARTQIHIRLRDEQPVDEFKMIAYADAIPSPALSLFKKPTVASSMTWTLDVLASPQGAAGDFWRMDAEVTAGGEGYLSQTATLSNAQGGAMALSRQSVVVFG